MQYVLTSCRTAVLYRPRSLILWICIRLCWWQQSAVPCLKLLSLVEIYNHFFPVFLQLVLSLCESILAVSQVGALLLAAFQQVCSETLNIRKSFVLPVLWDKWSCDIEGAVFDSINNTGAIRYKDLKIDGTKNSFCCKMTKLFGSQIIDCLTVLLLCTQ